MEQIKQRFDSDGHVLLSRYLLSSYFDGRESKQLMSHIDHYMIDLKPGLPPEYSFYEVKGHFETLKEFQIKLEYDIYFEKLL